MPKMSEEVVREEWDRFVEDHYHSIFAFCAQMLRSRADAYDATQDAFEKALRQYGTVRDEGARKGWMYQIARNTCLDKLRWWKRFVVPAEDLSEVSVTGSITLRHEIMKALQELPVRQREVFVLRHWHGFSTEESANILGISGGAVKTHLFRAVHALQRALGDWDSEVSQTADPNINQEIEYGGDGASERRSEHE